MGGRSGGVSRLVAGPEVAKNIRSTPMPAATSMADHVNMLNCGTAWSGPSRTRPRRLSATTTTKTTTTPAVST